jgi:hypothetical protein
MSRRLALDFDAPTSFDLQDARDKEMVQVEKHHQEIG